MNYKSYLKIIILLLVILSFIYIGYKLQKPNKSSEITDKAIALYNQKKEEGMVFSSQCLGTIEDYAVDIVHVPRNSADNLPENQCKEYMEGKVKHFIELDKDGDVVRIM